MATLSTLQTPIATKLVNEDGSINPIWNEFFVRLMTTAGITVSIDDLETETESLQTQIDNIDVEVSSSITMTDSDSNSGSTLAVLYDGNKTSDGVSYTVSGTDKFLQYKYGIEDYIDRIGIWVNNANGRIYIGYSSDGMTWNYLKAEADHTLTTENKFETATSQNDASTNYLQLATGQNVGIFPNNVFAKYVKVFFTGSYTTTVYEFIPSRILISEMAAIQNLRTLSATFGAMSGYDDITDKPTDLSDINSTEGTKLTGIEEEATDDSDIRIGYTQIIGDTISVYSDTLTVTAGVNDKLNWFEVAAYPALSVSMTGTITQTGNNFEKTSGSDGWDAQVYSTSGHTGGVEVSFSPAQDTERVMVGLDTNPTQDAGHANIDYCFYVLASGVLHIRESGAVQQYGTYSTDDVFSITYDGTSIIYRQNGETLRTVVVTISNALYLDSSFYDVGAAISNVQFYAFSSETATLTPSTSYTPTTLAAHVQTKMRAEGDANTTAVYNTTNKRLTVANSSIDVLSLLWYSGDDTDESCGEVLGFKIIADDSGALTYEADRGCGLRVLIGDLT